MYILKYIFGYMFSVAASFLCSLTFLSHYYAFNQLAHGNNLNFIIFSLIIAPIFGAATLYSIRKFYETIYEIDGIFDEKN